MLCRHFWSGVYLTQLQNAYEIIFDREFDKRNFSQKIHSASISFMKPTSYGVTAHRQQNYANLIPKTSKRYRGAFD